MDESPQPSLVDHLIQELQVRVAQRRTDGLYPAGLEQELDAHFARLVAHRGHADVVEKLRSCLEVLEVRGLFSPDRIPADTTLPGGEFLHRTVSRLVARQTQGVLEQMQEFGDVVREALEHITDALEDPYGHVHADLVGQLDAVFERLAAYERGPSDGAGAVGDLRRRVEMLEAAEQRRAFNPTYTPDAFETAFRGTRDELKARYEDLAQRLVGHGPVLDVGCGRGEFLELLGSLGIAARGIEVDPDLVKEATGAGLEVSLGDAVTALAAMPDSSLGAITLIQVIEHLTPQSVVDLVAVAREKLVPGGTMIVETVNPQSLYTFSHSFYVDPTHTTPVHPAYLTFLFTQAGWSQVTIDWRSEPPADETLTADPGASPAMANNINRLNDLLFAPQDYALVAVR